MRNMVFFLEGQSEKELLKGLMPRLVDRHRFSFTYIVFQGKHDLIKRSSARMKGWLKPNSAFVVLVDQDAEDCQELKEKMRREYEGIRPLIIRIACHELESWYFGDMPAVEKALGKKLSHYDNKRKYREPDKIQNPSEELRKITGGVYQKISGSRSISQYIALEKNKSPSFSAFVVGIRRLASDL